MIPRLSTLLLAVLAIGWLSGCASVQDTAQYYVSYTEKVYPPKPEDAPIPILGRSPKQPYKVIGRLAFQTPLNWNFLRKSMEYNARVNGADLVVLRDQSSRTETSYEDIPPEIEYVPVTTWITEGNGRNGRCRSYPVTNYVPVFRPGYTRVSQTNWIAIDAEMLVLKK